MTTLPVREMVLYKHGVGFFTREGDLTATEVSLTFRHDEINDILKSLTVFDRAGGQILGIHYPTPMDKNARLANSSIRLSTTASVRDLIRDLRGRVVVLTIETTPGTLETITGRIVGIDQPDKGDPLSNTLVSILLDDTELRVYSLNTLRSLTIQDQQSAHDMTYFLDTSMSEDTRRTVTVRLSEGDHQLVVSYVAPSPTWRVSYRIVAESDSPGSETGKALLQGWGLFDNRLEEDLENVKVTLVAGQPISFIYELYASRIPTRPTVQDQARIAPGPIEYEGAVPAELPNWLNDSFMEHNIDELAMDLGLADISSTQTMRPTATYSLAESPRPRSKKALAQSTPTTASTKESGEFFQYIVTAPVSVKRGESALVPIIGTEVPYSRELLYNGAKLPNHPVVALRFNNASDLTLERGPVTVIEDNDYKGEAIIAFTKTGNEVYLPYAVELGVRVTERQDYTDHTASLRIDQGYLIFEGYRVHSVTYILENTTAKPLTVTIEAPIMTDYEPFDTASPTVETATERRWRVEVPAKGRTEFTRKERWRTQRYEELLNQNYQNLQQYLENHWLDRETFNRLSSLLNLQAAIRRAQEEQHQLDNKRKAIYQRQEQLRANLGSLSATGQEAALRNRILAQLEASQDELEALEKRMDELTREIALAELDITQTIAALNG